MSILYKHEYLSPFDEKPRLITEQFDNACLKRMQDWYDTPEAKSYKLEMVNSKPGEFLKNYQYYIDIGEYAWKKIVAEEYYKVLADPKYDTKTKSNFMSEVAKQVIDMIP